MTSIFQGMIVFSGCAIIITFGMSIMRSGILFMQKPVKQEEKPDENESSKEEFE